VVLELPAPAAGVLVQIIKGDGSTVVADEVIAIIDTEGGAAVAAALLPLPSTCRCACRRCTSCCNRWRKATWPCLPPPRSWRKKACRRPTSPVRAKMAA
jgi:pyruvate/2-oxoglutarate dehydrogenase complex dihydrolipoamide acyltransferase (E2) component